jgi:glyceraldehyde 3-phosphate dehydrogenase
VHGRYPGTCEIKDGKLIIDGKPISISNEMDPTKIQWGASGADYVVESTGMFSLVCLFAWLNNFKRLL